MTRNAGKYWMEPVRLGCAGSHEKKMRSAGLPKATPGESKPLLRRILNRRDNGDTAVAKENGREIFATRVGILASKCFQGERRRNSRAQRITVARGENARRPPAQRIGGFDHPGCRELAIAARREIREERKWFAGGTSRHSPRRPHVGLPVETAQRYARRIGPQR